MQREDILEIITYVFKNFLKNTGNLPSDSKILTMSLQRAGFQKDAISKAFAWISELMQRKDFTSEPSEGSMHIFTSLEQMKIDLECRSYILFLEQNKILTSKNREIVISQLSSLQNNPITVADVKWVALMVLHCQPDQREALQNLEHIIMS